MINIENKAHFKMPKSLRTLNLLILLLSAIFSQQLYAQSTTISGLITDDSNEPVPGVSIAVKGSMQGTLSNSEGKYTLNLSNKNAVLVFSFVGYLSQEVPVNGRSIIDVTLKEDVKLLGEVVVTALNMKREEKALGYAMTALKGGEIAKVNTVNPVLGLQGQAAGLSIGASDGGMFGNSKIQLRGVSVLNSKSNQPIFVIDGVIIENAISNESADWNSSAVDFGNQLKNLNAADFESVSVLKGAAATALYGSRGINGAIVIKTKSGEGMKKGIGVNVTQSIGIDHVYATPDIQYEYGPGYFAGLANYGAKDPNGNYYRFSPMTQFYTNNEGVFTKINNAGSGLGYGPKYDGRPVEDFDGTMSTYVPYKNNMRDAFDTGVNTNTSISLRGANDKGTFYLSDSYNYRKGTIPENEFWRNSLLFSGTYDLAKWLKAEASISFTMSNPKNPDNSLTQGFFEGTFEGWYDTKRWKRRDVYQAPHGGVPSSDYGDQYAYVPGNSTWFDIYNHTKERKEQVTRPIARLTAKLADWMSVFVEGNMNYYTIGYEEKQLGSGYANDGGYYELRNDMDVSQTGKIGANINKKWNETWSSNLLFGGEIWNQRKEYTRSYTDGGLIVPGQFFIDNSKRTKLTNGTVNSTKQINSLYFLLTTSWKDQLYVDITGRNDWSSSLVYTNGTGNYSYFYPSLNVAWLFNETLELPKWINLSKLRLSLAQVGNDTDPYAINTGYTLSTTEVANGGFIYGNTKSTMLVDPSVKPEKKNSFEVGLDLRMFDSRVNVDFAFYNENINNQIGTIPLPAESGYENMFTNIGSMNNRGLELTLKVIPVQTHDFTWETTFNYWNSRSKITKMRPEVGEYKVLGGDIAYGNFRVGSVAFQGGEYGVLMSDSKPLEWSSDDPNDPRNGKKVLTWNESYRGAFFTRSYEVEKVGKTQPDFEGSWSNTFSYKGLSLGILIDARFGGDIASYSSRYGTAYGYLNTSLYARDQDHGGMSWTSNYADTKGQSFVDGIIPDGVFAMGQKVTAPNGTTVDVGGLTYQEAYEKGYVEPTHVSLYTYYNNSWSRGVVNSDWLHEIKYVALRNISLGYTVPKQFASKLRAQNLTLTANAQNLLYLYNNLPNNINPESFRGTSSSESYRERAFSPYTAYYTFTVSFDF